MLYLRKSGPGDKSPKDQEAVGRADIEALGGIVVAVYKDNLSASRYRKVHDRPGFVRSSDDLRAGLADGLWTWAHNRGHRDLDDYVELRRLCIDLKVPWRYAGRTYELWKSGDRQAANADAIRAEGQSDDISEATNRGIQSALKAGKPHGRLLKGFRIIRDANSGEVIRREPIPELAELIREAARRALPPAKESLPSIARDLEPRWIAAGGPGLFDDRAIRAVLVNPSYAGQRVYKGQIARPGTWEPILTIETHQQLVEQLTDPERTCARGTKPVHLCSYIATCADCRLGVRSKDAGNTPCYLCPDGHVTRSRARVDRHVEEVLLRLLEHPETEAKLMAEDTEGKASIDAELAAIKALRARKKKFVKDAARRGLDADDVGDYIDEINGDIAAAERRMKSLADPVLLGIAGPGAREDWAAYDMEQKRDVLRRAMRIEIHRVGRRGRYSELGVELYPLRGLSAVPLELPA